MTYKRVICTTSTILTKCIEKSEFKNNRLVNGYSVKNKVEDYDLGEFVEYKFKDNPETWKLRPEINRPWISTG